jgi:hypothetical protein
MTFTKVPIFIVALLISTGCAVASGLPACSDESVPEIKYKTPVGGGYGITRYSKIERGTSWQTVFDKYVAPGPLVIHYYCEEQPENSDQPSSIVYILRYDEENLYLILEIDPGGWVERVWIRR